MSVGSCSAVEGSGLLIHWRLSRPANSNVNSEPGTIQSNHEWTRINTNADRPGSVVWRWVGRRTKERDARETLHVFRRSSHSCRFVSIVCFKCIFPAQG